MAIHKRAKLSRGESATLVVAASDTDSRYAQNADFICPATDAFDYITNTVIPAMSGFSYGDIQLLKGTYYGNSDNKPISFSGTSLISLHGPPGGGALLASVAADSDIIEVGTTSYVNIFDLTLYHAGAAGNLINSETTSCDMGRIHDCHVMGQVNHGIYGAFHDCLIYNMTWENAIVPNGYNAMYFYGVPGPGPGSSRTIISNNLIRGAYGNGITIDSTSQYSYRTLITGNILESSQSNSGRSDNVGITITGGSGIQISDNLIASWRGGGMKVDSSAYAIDIIGNSIVGSSERNTGVNDGIYIGTADRVSIIGNVVRKGSYLGVESTYGNARYGINVSASATNIRAANNDLSFAGITADFYDAGTNTIYYDVDSVVYGNLLAEDTNHVVAGHDMQTTGACVIAAQPDVPRNITITVTDGDTSISAFVIDVVGKDANNRDITEQFTFAGGLVQTGARAYLSITSVTLTSETGAGAGDTLDVGIGKKFGFVGQISATGDVYAFYQNGVKSTGFTPVATYYTVTPDALAAFDDITFTYRKNANVLTWT